MPISEFTFSIEHRFQVGDRIHYTGRSTICRDFYNKECLGLTITGVVNENMQVFYTYVDGHGHTNKDAVSFIDSGFDKSRGNG